MERQITEILEKAMKYYKNNYNNKQLEATRQTEETTRKANETTRTR